MRRILASQVTATGPMDLVIDDVLATPDPFSVGQEVRWSAVVRNAGGTATPAGTICGVIFTVDGSLTTQSWSDTYTASIPPGQSVVLEANGGDGGKSTWTAASGTHNVDAFVDDINRYGALEPNKANNHLIKAFSPGAAAQAPDAVLNDTPITFAPASPTAGQSVTITKPVRNAGNVEIDAGSFVFSVDGATVATVAAPVIAPGNTTNVSATWTASTGTHNVVVNAVNISGTV